jgi:glutathione S-transferase
MSNTTQPVLLYGVPFSQPVRAVMWLMLYKRLPFEMVLINPGSQGDTGSRNPTYLAKNPGGTIPTIEERDTGFVLGEAHAIMCYLSNKHGWDDVYPTDHRLRAKVDWYLHYHHRNVREASVGLVAPKIRKDLHISEATQHAARATLTNALHALESGWLAESRYLTGAQLTLADFAAYVEIGQLQPGFTNVYDFAPFPKRAALVRADEAGGGTRRRACGAGGTRRYQRRAADHGDYQKREQTCTQDLAGKTGGIAAVTDIPGPAVSAERASRLAIW